MYLPPTQLRRRGLGVFVFVLIAVAAIVGQTTTATADSHRPPVRVSVITPSDHGTAGANGQFNVDVQLQARRRSANHFLSQDAGYRPFLNLPPAATFGPGMPDPGAPGLVVLLSTTPAQAGGPNANLAGVFQLSNIERVNGRNTSFADWIVGSPGFFGTNVDATLTVFVVNGTAPGQVDMAHVHPISNVARVHFHEA
jgi:hypothetical protein